MFFKDTIDSVIADIHSKIAKLRELAEEHHNKADGHSQSAADHTAAAADHVEKRDWATRIAAKFEELLKWALF